jgi:hypothetical protein
MNAMLQSGNPVNWVEIFDHSASAAAGRGPEKQQPKLDFSSPTTQIGFLLFSVSFFSFLVLSFFSIEKKLNTRDK